MRLKSFIFHIVTILRFNLLKYSRMCLLSFLVKKFHFLHSLHGEGFFSCCFSGVSGIVIFQSFHYSRKRLCMWHFLGILGVKIVSEWSSVADGPILSPKSLVMYANLFLNAEFFILRFIFYLQIQNLYNSFIDNLTFLAVGYLCYVKNIECSQIIYCKL